MPALPFAVSITWNINHNFFIRKNSGGGERLQGRGDGEMYIQRHSSGKQPAESGDVRCPRASCVPLSGLLAARCGDSGGGEGDKEHCSDTRTAVLHPEPTHLRPQEPGTVLGADCAIVSHWPPG